MIRLQRRERQGIRSAVTARADDATFVCQKRDTSLVETDLKMLTTERNKRRRYTARLRIARSPRSSPTPE